MRPVYYELIKTMKHCRDCISYGKYIEAPTAEGRDRPANLVEEMRMFDLYLSPWELLPDAGGVEHDLLNWHQDVIPIMNRKSFALETSGTESIGGINQARLFLTAKYIANDQGDTWAVSGHGSIKVTPSSNWRFATHPFMMLITTFSTDNPMIMATSPGAEPYAQEWGTLAQHIIWRFMTIIRRPVNTIVKDTITVPNVGPKAVRKKKPTVEKEYNLVVLRSEVKKYRNREWQGGTHASPIEHERAGHWRTIHRGTEKERRVYVRGCTINPGNKIPTAYRIDP